MRWMIIIKLMSRILLWIFRFEKYNKILKICMQELIYYIRLINKNQVSYITPHICERGLKLKLKILGYLYSRTSIDYILSFDILNSLTTPSYLLQSLRKKNQSS